MISLHMDKPKPIISETLSQLGDNSIIHGFFTRQGGVSEGIYAGLNTGLGSSDAPDRVMENRSRVAAFFGQPAAKLATVHQVHSAIAHPFDHGYDGRRPEGDGLVTATPGLVLGILTADCGPVLFADPEARIVGAAHAGWKGALDGVLESTIVAMERLGAKRGRIVASLGPSISQSNYEVGPEFVDRFLARDPACEIFFRPSSKPGYAMFDLPGLTIQRLSQAGVRADKLDICTYADDSRFFSFRRTTHRKEGDYGRQISAIMIKEH